MHLVNEGPGVILSFKTFLSFINRLLGWTRRPGVLQFTGSQRVGHDWVTERNWTWTDTYIDEKLINQSKKEMETFIWAKFEDYNPGNASQDAMRTVLPIRSQGTVTWVFWAGELYIKWCVIDSLHNPDLSLEWPLTKSRRNAIFF